MPTTVDAVLLTYPAREITDREQEQVRRWEKAAEGLTAFISQRRSDDPLLYHHVVISPRNTRRPSYTIHAPHGWDVWIVISSIEGEDIGRFGSLQAALEYVQPTVKSEPQLPEQAHDDRSLAD